MGAPYITAEELYAAPTGIEWSSVPKRGATTEEQLAEARRIIRRATSWVNTVCRQKLFATTDLDAPLRIGGRRCRWNQDGSIYVLTTYSPVIAVSLLEHSWDGVTWNTLPWVPLAAERSISGASPASVTFVPPAQVTLSVLGSQGRRPDWLRITYLDGYPNAFLTAAASASDTAVVVDDPTGVQPGERLTIYDGERDEDVVVATSYSGGATLPLMNPLAFDHGTGVQASGIPEAVREAVLFYATDLVRQRGKDAFAVLPTGGARLVQGQITSKLDQAEKQLLPWKRLL
jgi:hypothetical protein